jgi:hypothetical protein
MHIRHDQSGRVGPPRCQECYTPLGADDAAFNCLPGQDVAFEILCSDCQSAVDSLESPERELA